MKSTGSRFGLQRRVLATLAAVLLGSGTMPAGAAEWYVAPDGTAAGKGTRASPWDIASALAGKQSVRPGDTVLLLAGTYRRRPAEQFEVKLAGAEGKPIHVRPAPDQRVRIDGGLLVQNPSTHLWIWDLEIFVSEPQPLKPVGPGSHPKDFTRPWGGLNVTGGSHCKFINLVIHECRQGVSWWVGSTDSELHGCLIYDNGWPAVDRGHGHAIYTQNQNGLKVISDCIMTGGHSYTMHAYGSSRAFVDHYLVEGNICYKAGSFLIGGGKPSKGIRVRNNYLHGVSMRIGYTAPHNEDCEVHGNTIVNGALEITRYKKADKKDNLVLAKGAKRPSGFLPVLRPNKYDRDRANLAIFNWDGQAMVDVAAGAFLKKGEAFRLLNPRDFFGKPVLAGTYDGQRLRVPMAGEFAAFVLLRGTAARP
ncbi:MAG: right-handed parallel beta-helix repeat-containing protein [Gemmataceae bacterium]|nr:right-handed parallel beta-helix repeat-containing protein [Gemmataceae bacterium]